jgi:curli production assembly/transport component CsgE
MLWKKMKSTNCLFSVVILFLLVCPSLSIADEVELGNLVINKTITRVGDEFFEAFSDRWYPLRNMGNVHIRINEVPSARWGSIISVSVGQEVWFRTRLSNRATNIEKVAEQAVRQVIATLATRSIRKQQEGDNGDLIGDGL